MLAHTSGLAADTALDTSQPLIQTRTIHRYMSANLAKQRKIGSLAYTLCVGTKNSRQDIQVPTEYFACRRFSEQTDDQASYTSTLRTLPK